LVKLFENNIPNMTKNENSAEDKTLSPQTNGHSEKLPPRESRSRNPSSIMKWIIKETDRQKFQEKTEPLNENKEVSQDSVQSLSNMTDSERNRWKNIMFGKDPDVISDLAKVRQQLTYLSENPNLQKEELIYVLDELNFLVEITPNVTVFMHANGVDIVSPHLASDHSEIRQGVALCLTSCVMNNEAFQKHLHEKEFIKTLFGF